MKKILSIVEILILSVITVYNGLRFDGLNSRPYYLESGIIEITLFILLVITFLYRTRMLWKLNFKLTRITTKQQLIVLVFYMLAISNDIYTFSIWEIHSGYFGEYLVFLCLPILLGITNQLIKRKNDTPTRNKTNA